jgi:hypothetical protein
MAAPTVTLSLLDAKRLLKLLDAYGYVSGKASKWGYGIDAREAWFAAADRLKVAVDAARQATDG